MLLAVHSERGKMNGGDYSCSFMSLANLNLSSAQWISFGLGAYIIIPFMSMGNWNFP